MGVLLYYSFANSVVQVRINQCLLLSGLGKPLQQILLTWERPLSEVVKVRFYFL